MTEADYLAKLTTACKAIRKAIIRLASDEVDLAAVTRATNRAYRLERYCPPGSCDLISDARSGLEAAIEAAYQARLAARLEAMKAVKEAYLESRKATDWMRN